MIIYPDTERELFMEDYKPVSGLLSRLALPDLLELQNNLENALENAFIYHSELLEIAITMDLNKVNLYVKMRQRKQAKHA